MITNRNGGDPIPKPLTPQQLKDWNEYVDWLEKKGMKGSRELDRGETSFKWLEQFRAETPQSSITKEDIKSIQYEMDKLANNVRDFERRKSNPNAEALMQGTSQLDGIPGSKTTSFKFPIMQEQDYYNDDLIAQRNLGLVNGDVMPTGMQQSVNPLYKARKKQLPQGAKLEKLNGGLYYEDPYTGDLVKYE